MTATWLVAGLALAIWIYLILFRGGFWRLAEHDAHDRPATDPQCWPPVVAIVPARDEADVAPLSIASLAAQDYPASFAIILVDDNSSDGTAERVREAVAPEARLTILSGAPLTPPWTGKLWAVHQGLAHIAQLAQPPKYVLLTDADIVHAPRALRSLVARAERDRLLLTSRMVRLRCESLPERALIPAFVFFFQMLYPFAWVNRGDHRTAAAAGGCMLIDRRSLAAAGGVAAIRDCIIDDCALGARLKALGPIWLGLTDCAASIRSYATWGDVRRMVARSAYAQLDYSPLFLIAAIAGLALTFLAPALVAACASGIPRLAAIAAWALMATAFWPTLRFYRRSPLWALLLPVIAAVYMAFTLDGAHQYLRQRGGMWKGRAQAPPATGPWARRRRARSP
jgi:hopene-associated glycosyltransferase HpnB